MIKVLYDHQHLSEQRFGGISRYFANLIAGVKSAEDFRAEIGMLYNQNHYLQPYQFNLDNMIGRLIFETKPSRIRKWNKQYSKYLIRKSDFDLLHPTYYHPYFLKNLKRPYIVTVHDMIYELRPGLFPPDEPIAGYKRMVIGQAAGVIAVSETTKRDLMQVLNVTEECIRVIYHGIDPELPESKAVHGIHQSYILFVGERTNYKNFDRLLQCFTELVKDFPELQLVCAGGKPFSDAELQLMKQLCITNKCRQLVVDDAQLNWLYQHAEVFVFPSEYEGFGYPLLEAFRAGCPVAASNTGALPEIGGDAACYFDPVEVYSMYKSVSALLKDQQLRKDLIEKGYKRVTQFPLHQEIDQTLGFYHEIAGK